MNGWRDLVKNVCDEFMRPNLNLERLFLVIQNNTMGTLHQSIGLSLKNLMQYINAFNVKIKH